MNTQTKQIFIESKMINGQTQIMLVSPKVQFEPLAITYDNAARYVEATRKVQSFAGVLSRSVFVG